MKIIGNVLSALVLAYLALFFVFSTMGMVKFIAWCVA